MSLTWLMTSLSGYVILAALVTTALAGFDVAVQETLRHVDVDVTGPDIDGCSCSGLACACCQQISIKELKFKSTVCANIIYEPDTLSVEFKLTVDGKTLLSLKFSVKNPPPLCAGIPYIEKLASICVKFYNLDWKNHALFGCVKLEINIVWATVEEIDLGCFKIPPGEPKSQISPERKGVTGIMKEMELRDKKLKFIPYVLRKALKHNIQV